MFELLREELGEECITDCSHQGECKYDVQAWRESLNFKVKREEVTPGLLGYGAWDEEQLAAKGEEELAELVLWLACGDFQEDPEQDSFYLD